MKYMWGLAGWRNPLSLSSPPLLLLYPFTHPLLLSFLPFLLSSPLAVATLYIYIYVSHPTLETLSHLNEGVFGLFSI